MSSSDLQMHIAYHAAEQELLKHVATLDTAALLFVSAFLGKVTVRQGYTGWLVIGVSCLIISMMTVVGLQLHSLQRLRDPEYDMRGVSRLTRSIVFFTATFGLVVGLGFVGLFAIDTFI
ncbi:MAG: hypothetical protein M3Z30_07640 [Gemmatimonadota bacterium]|nr:hypothetical protein [Gemmatimonadota bacterium]